MANSIHQTHSIDTKLSARKPAKHLTLSIHDSTYGLLGHHPYNITSQSSNRETGDPCPQMLCSATLLLISSRNELKPVELDNREPSKVWSSTRYFSNSVVSSCAPWMKISLGVIFLSCFSLSTVDLNRPAKIISLLGWERRRTLVG